MRHQTLGVHPVLPDSMAAARQFSDRHSCTCTHEHLTRFGIFACCCTHLGCHASASAKLLTVEAYRNCPAPFGSVAGSQELLQHQLHQIDPFTHGMTVLQGGSTA